MHGPQCIKHKQDFSVSLSLYLSLSLSHTHTHTHTNTHARAHTRRHTTHTHYILHYILHFRLTLHSNIRTKLLQNKLTCCFCGYFFASLRNTISMNQKMLAITNSLAWITKHQLSRSHNSQQFLQES